jgi:hypothetical protein
MCWGVRSGAVLLDGRGRQHAVLGKRAREESGRESIVGTLVEI